MGELSPIPNKYIDPAQFEQFKADLTLLLKRFTQEELGNAMGMARSNFNGYVKGSHPITKRFLKIFYGSLQDWIDQEKARHPRYDPPTVPPHDPTNAPTDDFPPNEVKEPSLTDILTILLRIESKIDQRMGGVDKKN
jgi:transcriptional regulator with XRE-family HTH domain